MPKIKPAITIVPATRQKIKYLVPGFLNLIFVMNKTPQIIMKAKYK
jgi:hypothetical protein